MCGLAAVLTFINIALRATVLAFALLADERAPTFFAGAAFAALRAATLLLLLATVLLLAAARPNDGSPIAVSVPNNYIA